jgi:hypothetical protein
MSGNQNSGTPQKDQGLKPWRRDLNVAGLLVLGGLGYCTSLYFTAETRIGRVCSEFTPGQTAAATAKIAEAHGMNAPRSSPSTAYVVESATFGRYGCKLEFREDILQSSTYEFHD